MALQRQGAEFPFLKGVSNKRHPHRNLIPGLDTATNVSFEEPGAIIKRRGFADIGATVVDDSSVPSSWDRCDSLGERLVLWGGSKVYEYLSQADELSVPTDFGRGMVVRADSDTMPDTGTTNASGSTLAADRVQYAATNGYEMIACGNNTGVSVYVRDSDTGAIASAIRLGAVGECRAIAVGNFLMYFFPFTSNQLRVAVWDTANHLWSTESGGVYSVVVASDLNGTDYLIDAEPANTTQALVAYSTTSPTLKVALVGTDGVIDDSATWGSVAADQCIAVFVGATDYLIAHCDSTNGLQIEGRDANLDATNNHVLDAGATGTRTMVFGEADGSSRATILYGDGNDIVMDRVNQDGTAYSYSAITIYGYQDAAGDGLDIATKPLSHASGLYFVMGRGSYANGDASHVLVRVGVEVSASEDIEPVAYFRPLAEAGGDISADSIPCGIYQVGTEYRCALIGYADADTKIPLIAKFELFAGDGVEAMGSLYLPGNGVWAGNQMQQAGFGYPPRIISVTPTNGAGTLNNNGVYRWIAVYEYVDAAGNRHYSPPSTPSAETTFNGTDDTAAVVVTAPMARSGMTVYTRLYRVEDAGSIYYYTDISSSDTVLDAGTVTLTDVTPDTTIAANAVLYTEGGRLDAYPPPSTGRMVLHGNRLWTIAENGDLWPSRELVQGEAPAWNPALAVQVGGRVEKPVALASSGDGGPLVVFFRKRIAYVYGDGPNDQGVGGAFSQVQFLEGVNAGTDNPRSVVASPDGIWFDDPDHGYPMLLPTGAQKPIAVGADAEDFFTEDVVAAHVLEDRHEVRFFMGERQWAVYSYEDEVRDERGRGQWSLSTAAGLGTEDIVDAAVLSGRSVYVTDGGTIRHERTAAGNKLDNTTYYTMTVQTGYIPLGSLQGLKRCWDLLVLGEWVDNHSVAIYIESGREGQEGADTFDFADAETSALGDYELPCHLRAQLAKVYRVQIADGDEGTNNGDSFKLTGLRAEYGVSRGRRTGVRKGASVGM